MGPASPSPIGSSSPAAPFFVGGCLVRPDRNEIVSDGHPRRLEPRAMQVLGLLAERAGEVVTKDELHATVWAGSFVSDHVLSHVIWQLRSALGHTDDRSAVIATVAKRGYLLVAPVRPAAVTDLPPSARAPVADGQGGRDARTADAARPELPGAPRGEPAGPESTADPTGTERATNPARMEAVAPAVNALSAPLSTVPGQDPAGTPRPDVLAPRAPGPASGQAKLPPRAQRRPARLGRAGLLVVCACALLAWVGADIWTPAGKPSRAPGRLVRSSDPEAAQLYVKGLALLEDYGDLVGADRALQHFRAAVERDPHFGTALAGLAMVYLQKMMYQSQPAAFRREAEQAAARAIAEDPDSADGYMVLGRIRGFYDWDWSGADEAFEQGIARHPVTAFPRNYYSAHLVATGRATQAERFGRETLQLVPASRSARAMLVQALSAQGRDAEAAALAEQTLAGDPAFTVMHRMLSMALIHIDPDRAVEEVRKVTVPDSANVLAIQAAVTACAGRRDEAARLRSQLLTLMDTHYVRPTRLAYLETCLGNTDEALRWLEQGLADHELDMAMVRAWRWTEPLRGDARFARIVESIRLPALPASVSVPVATQAH